MNRVSLVVFVACVVGAVAWLMVHERDDSSSGAHPAGSGSSKPAPHEVAATGAGAVGIGGAADVAAAGSGIGVGLGVLDGLDDGSGSGGNAAAADSSGVLDDAPKFVRFGVVLVQYAGAQGASRGARSRGEADQLAGQLAAMAKEDFAAAVKKGDPGSVDDAGRMFRGILEPKAELALFSLGKGEVSAPVDTPRGLWIVKRID